MADPLTFAIVADNGKVTLDALHGSVERVRKLVHDVDGVVTQRRSRVHRAWYITDFHSSSPTITITPASDGTDSGERAARAVVTGIAWVNTPGQRTPPPHFSERELEDLRSLRQLRGRGVSRIDFECGQKAAQVLPSRVEEQVDRILRAGDTEYGSLEGELDAVNLHGHPTLTIWESITGLAVRCSFPQDYEATVRQLLRKRVRIGGLIHYFADGRPRRITEFNDIEDLTPDSKLPRAAFGSIPNLTDRVGSERHLKIVREA